MALDQFHPLCDSEIAEVPRQPGVYVLFQIQIPIHADSTENLRKEISRARKRFPRASHFAVEPLSGDARSIRQRAREVQERLKLVRTGAFVGSPR
ncbi:MAG: hypothetical protein ACRD20_04080 [Terriglobales bacterium]